MSDEKSAGDQLAEAIKAVEAATAKVEALKKQTREEDLATTKRLIKTHGFTATDLKPELKPKTTSRTVTPRKSTARRKQK